METKMPDASSQLAFRSGRLIFRILYLLKDKEDDQVMLESFLIEQVADEADASPKTVRRVVDLLRQFGAIHRLGRMAKHENLYRLELSDLGRLWMDQEAMPPLAFVRHNDDDEEEYEDE